MMDADFSPNTYRGYLIKGDLIGAVRYVKQFPGQEALYDRFMAVFGREQYAVYEADAFLDGILTVYQRYYRDAFYLRLGKEAAANKLKAGLAGFLGIDDEHAGLCGMEQNQVAEAFQSQKPHVNHGGLEGLPAGQVQTIAKELFEGSNRGYT